MLHALADRLRQSLGIQHKKDIQAIAAQLGQQAFTAEQTILLGDDCAAIADGTGYLLLAAEGILPDLVRSEPWFAGWCGVLVNVSDIYAMGGRPIAVVDVLWSQTSEQTEQILAGMRAAAQRLNVPIVGGHSNGHSPYNALAVAILGRAQTLLSSFTAQPGDRLLLLSDFDGQAHPHYPFWDAATSTNGASLQAKLNLLPELAEQGLCDTAKDISMGGILGTTLMLLETSKLGACFALERIPVPPGLTLETWLISFPSYGFLLSVRPLQVAPIQALAKSLNLVCADIGVVTEGNHLTLQDGETTVQFWDLAAEPLIGF